MVCIECNEPIRKGDEYQILVPGKKVIHEDCFEGILDRPARLEDARSATQTRETVSMEWTL
jgi:hypothetical protein